MISKEAPAQLSRDSLLNMLEASQKLAVAFDLMQLLNAMRPFLQIERKDLWQMNVLE